MPTDRYVIGIIQKKVKDSFLYYKEGNIGVKDPNDGMIFNSSKEAWKYAWANGFYFHQHLTIVVDIHPEDRYAD
jgi:hypothetical protein